jgi:hypothetical protein
MPLIRLLPPYRAGPVPSGRSGRWRRGPQPPRPTMQSPARLTAIPANIMEDRILIDTWHHSRDTDTQRASRPERNVPSIGSDSRQPPPPGAWSAAMSGARCNRQVEVRRVPRLTVRQRPAVCGLAAQTAALASERQLYSVRLSARKHTSTGSTPSALRGLRGTFRPQNPRPPTTVRMPPTAISPTHLNWLSMRLANNGCRARCRDRHSRGLG